MEVLEKDLPLDIIDEPSNAMRSDIPREDVFELADDIKRNGLISPITVRPRGERYEVVAGHRRFLAHRYGGILKIRCIVRELSDDEALAIMTSENLKRQDVNPLDEATHISRLLAAHEGDINKVAEIVGYSPAWVESRATINIMSDILKTALKEGKIKLGVAFALHEITTPADQQVCLDMAISQGASVVVAQYYVAQWKAGLFGHTLEQKIKDSDAPDGVRRVVMLRDAIDGKEYPASDFVTFLVSRKNEGLVLALSEHVKNNPEVTETPHVEDIEEDVIELDSSGGETETEPEGDVGDAR